MIESAAGQSLSAACFGLRSEHGRPQRVPGLSAEASREFEQTWQQMQGELAARSSREKRITAEKSGHFIQLDQPELVIDAIREVVEAARHRQCVCNRDTCPTALQCGSRVGAASSSNWPGEAEQSDEGQATGGT